MKRGRKDDEEGADLEGRADLLLDLGRGLDVADHRAARHVGRDGEVLHGPREFQMTLCRQRVCQQGLQDLDALTVIVNLCHAIAYI